MPACRWKMGAIGLRYGSDMPGINDLEYASRTILLCRDYVPYNIPDEEIYRQFASMQVLCVSDLRNLRWHSGQVAIITLVSLISRMGMQINLALADAPLVFPQPPLSGRSVCEALTGASGRLLPNANVLQKDTSHPDVIFALGDSRVEEVGVPCWRLSTDDWNGKLTLGIDAVAHRFSGDWPIGAMASAALAAGEAFKFVMRRMSLQNPDAKVFFKPSASCGFGVNGVPAPPKGFLDCGEVDIISAGAISQSALYVLTRLPRVKLVGRIFDNDQTGPSNLNRNMLSLIDDVGLQKVEVVARRCAPKL